MPSTRAKSTDKQQHPWCQKGTAVEIMHAYARLCTPDTKSPATSDKRSCATSVVFNPKANYPEARERPARNSVR